MKKLILAAMTMALVAGCQVTQSPTGRSQALFFSKGDMDKLGKQSFEEIKKKETVLQDQRINAYVQCVTRAVTQKVPAKYNQKHWEVVVFQSDAINAFALPGGYIGVYTGLLDVASTPERLAAVIGHEIGHVLSNHANERLSRSQLTSLGLNVANVAFDLGGIAHKDLWMQGLGLGAQYGIALPFGRKQESESDKIGLDLMSRAGFDPNESVELWKAMAKANKSSGPEFLSSHPSPQTRINDLKAGMKKANEKYIAAHLAGNDPNCKI